MLKRKIAVLALSLALSFTSVIAYADTDTSVTDERVVTSTEDMAEDEEILETNSKQIVKEYQFTTTNPDYSSYTAENVGTGDMADIPTEIEDGFFKVKKVTDIRIKLLSEKGPKTKVFENYLYKELKDEDKTAVFDGETLDLLKVDWEEVERTITGEASETVENVESRPTFSNTKEIDITTADDQTITVVCDLKDIEETVVEEETPMTIDVTVFGGEDVTAFQFGNIQVPNNNQYPVYKGYESAIIRTYGRNPQINHITGSRYTDDWTYDRGRGEYVRHGVYTGYRSRSYTYKAFYKENLTENSNYAKLYKGTAYYGESLDTFYSVDCKVIYGKTEYLVGRILGVAAGIILLLVLAIFLVFLKKKKKDEEEEPETEAV